MIEFWIYVPYLFRFLFFLSQRVSAVRAACWSLLSPDTLFTADETGIVVVWDARINRWEMIWRTWELILEVTSLGFIIPSLCFIQ